jgi:hypothetical protein
MNLLSFFPLSRLPECNSGELTTVAVFLFLLAGACFLAQRWGR